MLTFLLFALGTVAALADARSECGDWQNTPSDQLIVTCSTVISDDQEVAWAYVNRGIAYQRRGDYDLAIADQTKAIDLDPESIITYYNRGIAYQRKGDYDRAIADYTKVIDLDPKHAKVYRNRGVAYQRKSDYDRAITDYTKSIDLDPTDAQTYRNRGTSYNDLGDYDRSFIDYMRAIDLDPTSAATYHNRGIAYQRKGDYDRAIADYTKAIDLDPKDSSYARERGVAKYIIGDFKAASVDLLRAIELEDDPYAMLFRHLARSRAGEAAEAELGANASRIKSKEWPYAVIELYLGKRSLAATLGAASKPDDRCEAQFYVSQWHILNGNVTDSEIALRIAIETCPKTFTEFDAAVVEMKRLKP